MQQVRQKFTQRLQAADFLRFHGAGRKSEFGRDFTGAFAIEKVHGEHLAAAGCEFG